MTQDKEYDIWEINPIQILIIYFGIIYFNFATSFLSKHLYLISNNLTTKQEQSIKDFIESRKKTGIVIKESDKAYEYITRPHYKNFKDKFIAIVEFCFLRKINKSKLVFN